MCVSFYKAMDSAVILVSIQNSQIFPSFAFIWYLFFFLVQVQLYLRAKNTAKNVLVLCTQNTVVIW